MSELSRAEGLKVGFALERRLLGSSATLWALDGVTVGIAAGKTVGIVGESGCGKSTLGRALLGLQRPSAGRVLFEGVELATMKPEALRRQRRWMQLVFQDPYSSLNPRITIGSAIREPLDIHRPELPAAERAERVRQLLARVGLTPEQAGRLPGEFSGGQRQRVVIARALATEPKFVVADEPVSALDVSIQAQILNLLMDLKAERQLTMAFISHDLKAVRHVSDEVVVMYLGRVVERATTRELFEHPAHPYTQALLSAIPTIGPRKTTRVLLSGEIPSPLKPPSGCVFHPRCPLYATLSPEQQGRCRAEVPALGARAACHFV